MYHAFANGLFPIHENNFALYCKPHLRYLPPNTAVDLQKACDDLKPDYLPPYRPIQMDVLPEPTVPTFKTTLAQANIPPTLLPRAQWMKDTPPFLTDYEADTAYSAACAWMFGTEDPKDFPTHASSPTVPQSAFSPTTYKAAPVPRVRVRQDIQNPEHALHAKFQNLRHEITAALNNQVYIRDFSKHYIPYTAPDPDTFARLTSLLQMRDKVEHDMVNLMDRVPPNGTPFDPSLRTELDELNVEATIHDLNRLLFCEYVVFLSSAPST